MPEHEPYLAPPTERAPSQRLAGARWWLGLAILTLILLALAALALLADRQDPTLIVPSGATEPDGAVPQAPGLPEADES